MLPVLADGTPLCELPELADRPHAYVKLWKHHAAQSHADRINALAAERGEPWLARYGGRISSEWEFAKGLQLLDEDPDLYAADRALGRGRRLDRLATHRRLRPQRVRHGLQGDPSGRRVSIAGVPRGSSTRRSRTSSTRSSAPIAQLGARAGSLTSTAARWTGLPEGIAVCAGNVDAHVTAPAAQAIEPGQMVAIMGTSTCHVMSSDDAA